MKTTVLIPQERHEALLRKCDPAQPEYEWLHNGIIAEDQFGKIVTILCEVEQAERILNLARRIAPEAVPWIVESIHHRREA